MAVLNTPRLVRFADLAPVARSLRSPRGVGLPHSSTLTSHKGTARRATTTDPLIPHPSLLIMGNHKGCPLRPHSYDLTPPSSFLPPPSSLLTPHSSLLRPHSSLLIPQCGKYGSSRSRSFRRASSSAVCRGVSPSQSQYSRPDAWLLAIGRMRNLRTCGSRVL